MFSRDSRNGSGDAKDRVPSIISTSLRIAGDLVSEGDVQVDGVIEGDVSARSLIVSEGASVHGQIVAQKVVIRGVVQGQISADTVTLGKTARVVGDVLHNDLAIESGAFLEGNCRHQQRPPVAVETSAEEEESRGSRAING